MLMPSDSPGLCSSPAVQSDALLASGLSISFARLNEFDAVAITRRIYGIDGTATRFSTEKDDTFRIDAIDGARYVLKLSNPGETAEELDLQVAAMRHVATAAPHLPVSRVLPGIDGRFVVPLAPSMHLQRTARLYGYLEGTPLDALDPGAVDHYEIGAVLAQLQRALAGFRHPHEHRVLAWGRQAPGESNGVAGTYRRPLASLPDRRGIRALCSD
ncbi:phosphotransferase [Paraburkholderia hospita]|uniref:phosphotransferase n=1 Tax=Paraburkholderia hospita TaxID=169430 RepID=UPI001A97DBEA|nr:phosphotransferase [Paraburkholderia hospita]